MTAIICETCGFDLRGSPQCGRCPECGAEYCLSGLRENQDRSYAGVLFGLRILAVLIGLMVLDVLVLVVMEDFLVIRNFAYWRTLALIAIPGGAALLLAHCLILLWLKRGDRVRRPYYHPTQWQILPRQVRFWIHVNWAGLMIGFFFGWGNPFWKLLLRNIRALFA